ncbi:hypothetical protein COB52_02395 [Candidatus Kaiserbacteria bacterium]|nr:MAG: hypothetical protein COB52_02395 [Candidatus Kaiserbacteria bacterium]
MLEFLKRKPKEEIGMDRAVGRLADVEARIKGRKEVDPVEAAMASMTEEAPVANSAPKVEAPAVSPEMKMEEVSTPVPEVKVEEAPVSKKSMPSLDKYRETPPVDENVQTNVVSLDKARAEREEPKVIKDIFVEAQETTDAPIAENLNKISDVKPIVVEGRSLADRIKTAEATMGIIEKTMEAVEKDLPKEEKVPNIIWDTDPGAKKEMAKRDKGLITDEELHEVLVKNQKDEPMVPISRQLDEAPIVPKSKQFDGVTGSIKQSEPLDVKKMNPSTESVKVEEPKKISEESVEILDDTMSSPLREEIKKAITNEEERDRVLRILDQEELRRALSKVPANSPIKKAA